MEQVTLFVKKTVPITIIVFVVIIIFSIFMSLSNNKPLSIFGFKPLTVLSNSMVPAFKAGDVIIIREIEADLLEQGDIISFFNEEQTLITHRITSIAEENGERYFYTKGDNNNTVDEDVTVASMILGKEMFNIPNIGFLSNYTKGPMGFLVFIVLPLTGYICITVYEKMKLDKQQSVSKKLL
ncbi:signal peptidase I [Sutcliffiella halmapala]|uniref:signal peptidase I n=1 Tax=Sutcliffiella halmapala TaxID=79882 RepID=UPI0009958BE6|nr:signal peptidase I [Sutcliffiella halmapala]